MFGNRTYRQKVVQKTVNKTVVNNTYLIMGDYQPVNNIYNISGQHVPSISSRNADPNNHHCQVDRSSGTYLDADGTYKTVPIEMQEMRREYERQRNEQQIIDLTGDW